jgi:hypothetical protein
MVKVSDGLILPYPGLPKQPPLLHHLFTHFLPWVQTTAQHAIPGRGMSGV